MASIPTVFKAYNPDLYPDRAVGVLLPFNGNAQLVDIRDGYNAPVRESIKPFKLSYSTEEQAITNMVNLLLTRRGERPMQPRFGSPIPEYLFENNSPSNIETLKEDVEITLNFWLPYITVNAVRVEAVGDREILDTSVEHNVIISIECQVTDVGANRTVTFFVAGDGTVNTEVI